MINESKANQIGQRLRRERNARGWTQEVLGNKCNLSAQVISKYEKFGLSDVNIVTNISNVLGTDLWADEFETDNPVSEIGMEVLIQLMKAGGCLPFEEFITEHLLGLNSEKVTGEIVKLSNSGLCIRENYNDYWNREHDDLFITAKGAITCRHHISNPLISSEISNSPNHLITYENMLVDGFDLNIETADSMQDYYDKHAFIGIIASLPRISYRCNEIIYLKRYFGFDPDVNGDYFSPDWSLFLGWGFRYDLIHSMIMGLTKENVVDIISGLSDTNRQYWINDIYNQALSKMSEEELAKELKLKEHEDCIYNNAEKENFPHTGIEFMYSRFDELYPRCNQRQNTDSLCQISTNINASNGNTESTSLFRKIAEYNCGESPFEYINHMIVSTYKDKPYVKPEDLFTDTEILNYARDNLRPACTEEEKKVDEMILKINQLCPDTLQYYSCCSDELLDLAGKLYGIDTSIVKEKYHCIDFYPRHVRKNYIETHLRPATEKEVQI